MKFGNLLKEYRDFRYEMRSLPLTNPMRNIIRERMSDFLERTKNTYGQNIVDLLVKAPRTKNQTLQEKASILREADLL